MNGAALTVPLSAVIFLSAGLAVRGATAGPRWMLYLCKPLTTALILVLALVLPGTVASPYRPLLVVGLATSLLGDVFLMLPDDRLLPGLVSFLVTHLCYATAFASAAGWHFSLLPVTLLVGTAALVLSTLWPTLGRMRGPVLFYVAALLLMVWQADERWLQTRSLTALLALSGAVLFLVSDTVLALNRFRRHLRYGQAIILGSYWLAQYLIARSV